MGPPLFNPNKPNTNMSAKKIPAVKVRKRQDIYESWTEHDSIPRKQPKEVKSKDRTPEQIAKINARLRKQAQDKALKECKKLISDAKTKICKALQMIDTADNMSYRLPNHIKFNTNAIRGSVGILDCVDDMLWSVGDDLDQEPDEVEEA